MNQDTILDRAAVATRLPHSGAMVLLDAVESWTDVAVTCRTGSHRCPDNPLREEGRLPALSAIEYGAQAMALHGSLISGDEGRPGVLASVKAITCHVECLDDIPGDLFVQADLVYSQGQSFLYSFILTSEGRTLVSGQASVFLQ